MVEQIEQRVRDAAPQPVDPADPSQVWNRGQRLRRRRHAATGAVASFAFVLVAAATLVVVDTFDTRPVEADVFIDVAGEHETPTPYEVWYPSQVAEQVGAGEILAEPAPQVDTLADHTLADQLTELLADHQPQQDTATFAGAWIHRDATSADNEPVAVVAFTQDAPNRIVALRDHFPQAQRLKTIELANSLADLEALADRVRDDRDLLRDGQHPNHLPDPIAATEGDFDVTIDVVTNKVAVLAPPGSDITELNIAFGEQYGTHPDRGTQQVVVRSPPR